MLLLSLPLGRQLSLPLLLSFVLQFSPHIGQPLLLQLGLQKSLRFGQKVFLKYVLQFLVQFSLPLGFPLKACFFSYGRVRDITTVFTTDTTTVCASVITTITASKKGYRFYSR